MVHQNSLVISEETRQDLEDGGGTKSKTRAVRAIFGLNFVAYCEGREEAWCTAPLSSPVWWMQKEGELGGPRTMAELCLELNSELLGRYFKNWLWEMQVLKKDETGAEVADFPFYHTAAAARSHVKCFLLADYKLDISDKRRFPNWGAWWKAYLGEVLKPNGKMQVKHAEFLHPEFLEGVMELVSLACAAYIHRGTDKYEAILQQLPADYRDSYHVLIAMGNQYVITLFFAQRGKETMASMEVDHLVKEEDETLQFAYFREAKRVGSKNHYSDVEGCHNGGVIPDLNLTRGEYTFNPARVVETYLGMRDPAGRTRLMMQARKSVTYSEYGCRPAGGKRFNLHNPGEKTCFKPKNVMGVNKIDELVPTFSVILGLPRATNRQVRATAIQALRMASYTTEEVAKVSRHRRPSTIDKHYDPGLRTNTKADMAVAVAQAASMKRGNEFFSVSEHLPRKMSKATVHFKLPADMAPGDNCALPASEEPDETISFTPGCVGSEFIGTAWETQMSGDMEVSQAGFIFSQQVSEPDNFFAFGEQFTEPPAKIPCVFDTDQQLLEPMTDISMFGEQFTEPQLKEKPSTITSSTLPQLKEKPHTVTSSTLPQLKEKPHTITSSTLPQIKEKPHTVTSSTLPLVTEEPHTVASNSQELVRERSKSVSSPTCIQQLKPRTVFTPSLPERELAR